MTDAGGDLGQPGQDRLKSGRKEGQLSDPDRQNGEQHQVTADEHQRLAGGEEDGVERGAGGGDF